MLDLGVEFRCCLTRWYTQDNGAQHSTAQLGRAEQSRAEQSRAQRNRTPFQLLCLPRSRFLLRRRLFRPSSGFPRRIHFGAETHPRRDRNGPHRPSAVLRRARQQEQAAREPAARKLPLHFGRKAGTP